MTLNRVRPTEAEANILLDAQRDYIKRGNTSIKCPRCGKSLEYRCRESGETILCIRDGCISVDTRGI